MRERGRERERAGAGEGKSGSAEELGGGKSATYIHIYIYERNNARAVYVSRPPSRARHRRSGRAERRTKRFRSASSLSESSRVDIGEFRPVRRRAAPRWLSRRDLIPRKNRARDKENCVRAYWRRYMQYIVHGASGARAVDNREKKKRGENGIVRSVIIGGQLFKCRGCVARRVTAVAAAPSFSVSLLRSILSPLLFTPAPASS